MKKLVFMFMALLFAFGTVSAQTVQAHTEYTKYTGKIGPHAVTLYLNIREEVGNVAGYYYYDARPQSKFTLKLVKNEPSLGGFNRVELKEYTAKGNHTGTFRGDVVSRGDGFSGVFTTKKGKKYKFELVEE